MMIFWAGRNEFVVAFYIAKKFKGEKRKKGKK